MGEKYTTQSQEGNPLSSQVQARAQNASNKVRQRVEEIIIPNINEYGSVAKRWLMGLQNDFHLLVENPNDEVGGGNYSDWTPEEIRELYTILYGEEME